MLNAVVAVYGGGVGLGPTARFLRQRLMLAGQGARGTHGEQHQITAIDVSLRKRVRCIACFDNIVDELLTHT